MASGKPQCIAYTYHVAEIEALQSNVTHHIYVCTYVCMYM